MKSHFELKKNPCDTTRPSKIMFHHFHPLLRKITSDGKTKVWSYIVDDVVARALYGDEESKFSIADVPRCCWFVVPTYVHEVIPYVMIPEADERIEVQSQQEGAINAIELSLTSYPANEKSVEVGTLAVDSLINLDDYHMDAKNAIFDFVERTPVIQEIEKESLKKYMINRFFEKEDPNQYKQTKKYKLDETLCSLSMGIARTIMPNAEPSVASAAEQLQLAKIGNEVMQSVDARRKPSLRRPLLSFACKAGISRTVTESSLPHTRLNKIEWTNANKHALFPGPGEPILKKNHRKKCNEAALDQS